MRAGRTFLLLPLLLVGLWPSAAVALKYKPREAESLSHVAVMFYGKAQKLVYIQAANNIEHPDRMPQDRELWIPTVIRYQMRRGDDLSKVAKRYLYAAERAEFLIWLNQIKDPKNIRAGSLITIPFVIRHKVLEGQSLIEVANRYYWNAKQASLLRQFNGRKTNVLKAGEIVFVPIFDPDAMTQAVEQRLSRFKEDEAEEARRMRDLALQPKNLPPEPDLPAVSPDDSEAHADNPPSVASPAPPTPGPPTSSTSHPPLPEIGLAPASATSPPPPPEVALAPSAETETPAEDSSLLRESLEQVREGDFDIARAGLTRLLERQRLSRQDEIGARRALILCLVALESYKEAEHEFVRLLMLAPELELQPAENSPKVLEIFRRAKGAR